MKTWQDNELEFHTSTNTNAKTCRWNTKKEKGLPMSLSVHLCGLVCDGLGFRVNDGHFFCGYLSFLGSKRVWYCHHFCLNHWWLGREERDRWGGGRTERVNATRLSRLGGVTEKESVPSLGVSLYLQVNSVKAAFTPEFAPNQFCHFIVQVWKHP